MKTILTILLWCTCILYAAAQDQSSVTIRWTSFEQVDDSLRAQQKPLLVFINTDWCKFCRMQENITFQTPQIVESLNENYYCLLLDAEDTREITFLNRNYGFQPSSGYHELAEMLGKYQGELTIPTTVLMQIESSRLQRLIGFQSAEYLLNSTREFLEH